MIANKICEPECNTLECYHDGGDCPEIPELKPSLVDRRSFYKASLDFNNLLLNKNFSPKNRRMVPHMPLIRVVLRTATMMLVTNVGVEHVGDNMLYPCRQHLYPCKNYHLRDYIANL